MVIHVKDFVYGNISINADGDDARILTDDHGNKIKLNRGDNIIYCSNNPCQKWISDGAITAFKQDRYIEIDQCVNVSANGCAYIGILN